MIFIFTLGCLLGYLITYLINWYIKKEKGEQYTLRERIFLTVLIGLLFLINYYINEFTIRTLYTSILIILFFIISFVDLKCYIIPNGINILLFLFVLYLVIVSDCVFWIDNIDFFCVLIFNILLLLTIVIVFKIKKVEILGFGDMKFLFSMGLIFGLTNFSYALIISSIIALFVELIIFQRKRVIIPFGPYLSLGFLIIWFFNI